MQKLIIASLALTSMAVAQIATPVAMPAHTSVYNGFSRGWSCTALLDFTVVSLNLPLDAQQVGDTGAFLISVNGAPVHHSTGNALLSSITVCIPVQTGDVLRVVGNWSPAVPTNFTAHNSYASGAGGVYSTAIEGTAHTLYRAGQQWDVGDPNYGGTGFDSINGSIGRVDIETIPGLAPCAASSNYGSGCIAVYNSFYEFFSPGSSQDLDGTAFSIIQTPTGSVTIPSTTAARGTATATNTMIGDDAEISFAFAMGTTTMPSPDGPVTGLTVQSNGMVSTAPNTTSWTPNAAAFLAYPNAVWACHCDYRPFDGTLGSGGVYTEETATHFYVIWDAVESWGAPGPGNTFEYHFDKATGNCELIIVSLDGLGGNYLVGHSPGGPSADPGNTDLSALTAVTTANPEISPLSCGADGRPTLGSTVTLTVSNIPAGSPVSGIIFSHGIVNPGVDLAGLGMPGCFQYANMHSVVLLPGAVGSGSAALAIPNLAGLTGLIVGAQGASYSPGINAGNAISSNGVKLSLGN